MRSHDARDEAAERALLGAALIDPALARAICESVADAAAFSAVESRETFIALRDLVRDGTAVDPITIQSALKRRGTIDRVGVSYLGALLREVHTSANWRHYLGVVKDRLRARRLLGIAEKLDRLDAKTPAEEIAESLRVWLQLADEGSGLSEVERESATYNRALDERGDKVATGIAELDDVFLGGWLAGLVAVVAARTSSGKSTVLLNLAVAATRAGTRVDVHPWELGRVLTLDLLVSHVLQQPKVEIIANWKHLPDELRRRIRDAVDPLVDAGLKVHLSPTERGGDPWPRTDSVWSANAARLDRVERMIEDSAAAWIIFDLFEYALEMRRPEDWGRAMERLRLCADRQRKHLTLVHQVNRMKDDREDARPQLRHLRGSGDLENKAHLVAVLYQPGLYKRVKRETVDLTVLKQTLGGRVGVRVEWDTDWARTTISEPRLIAVKGGGEAKGKNGNASARDVVEEAEAEGQAMVDGDGGDLIDF